MSDEEVGQARNDCAANCAMGRSDKGCIPTILIPDFVRPSVGDLAVVAGRRMVTLCGGSSIVKTGNSMTISPPAISIQGLQDMTTAAVSPGIADVQLIKKALAAQRDANRVLARGVIAARDAAVFALQELGWTEV